MKSLRPLMELAHQLIDTVAAVRLSDSALKLTRGHRQSKDELNAKRSLEERQERIAQRKAEELASERAKLRSLPRDQQRKMDEKNRKRQMKKQMGARMRVKMV